MLIVVVLISVVGVWVNGRQLKAKCHVEYTRHIPFRNIADAGQPVAYLIGTIESFILCHATAEENIVVLCYVWPRPIVEFSEEMYTIKKTYSIQEGLTLIHVDSIRRQVHLAPFYTDIKVNKNKRSASDQIIDSQEPNVEFYVDALEEKDEQQTENPCPRAQPQHEILDPNAKLIAIPMRQVL